MRYPRHSVRIARYAVQLFFLILTVYVGWRFSQFVLHFEVPGNPFVPRPSSVDAFLPIGGFMAFKYFILTGIVDPVHPAGFILFVAITGVSLFLRRGFCGWICPVGTVSQYTWMAGEKIFGRTFTVPKGVDIGLRSLKYVLLSFFLFIIGVAMAPSMMVLFFITDYYKAVDVRMMKFFTEMSVVAFWVILALLVLSFLYKNFWCRYLCPYGALLGLLGRLSPVSVRRDNEACVHCGACTRHCPTLIDVEASETVKSAECFGCLTCVSRCPSKGALDVYVRKGEKARRMSPFLFPLLLVGFFYLVVGIGVATGKWHSKVPYEEYQRILPEVKKEYDSR